MLTDPNTFINENPVYTVNNLIKKLVRECVHLHGEFFVICKFKSKYKYFLLTRLISWLYKVQLLTKNCWCECWFSFGIINCLQFTRSTSALCVFKLACEMMCIYSIRKIDQFMNAHTTSCYLTLTIGEHTLWLKWHFLTA